MVISAYLLYNGYSDVKSAHLQARGVIEVQQTKYRLLTTMFSASRERSVILLKMLAEEDLFELDDLKQVLSLEASNFIAAHQQFTKMKLGKEEKLILAEQNEAVRYNAPLQNRVAELFVDGERDQARELLFNKAIPGQVLVLKKISNMLALYEKTSITAIADINSKFESASLKFQILAAALLITTALFILFAFLIARRDRYKLQSMLAEQQEISAQLDLSSEKLSYQASHDALTDLINRREFENRLSQLLHRAEEDKTHVVFYLDLDQFKIVNDTCGHHAVDELLRGIAVVMQSYIRKSDVLARLGGDEFGIILEYCEFDLAENIAQSIIQAVGDYRFRWERKTFRIGVSIGIVMLDDNADKLENILKQIDSACYAAKDAGRNRYHFYNESDKKLVQRKKEMDWIVRLDRGHEQNQFTLYAQPIVPVNARRTSKNSYELLIRLIEEDGTIVLPGAFLPAAERYNKMVNIDRWVLSEALSILASNPQFLEHINYCSINISGQSLTDAKFLDFVVDKIASHEDLATKICFEITETAAIINLLQANRNIAILSGMGLRFSLDDFGSGLSSFGYLKTLPIDYLKIDGMFVRDIVNDPIDRAMVKSIHEIGSVMGKTIVAEYVENEDILEELRTIGVHYAQGYGVGKPLPLKRVIKDINK
jgi:diguanylate cyclase (GGDEF)-like protein